MPQEARDLGKDMVASGSNGISNNNVVRYGCLATGLVIIMWLDTVALGRNELSKNKRFDMVASGSKGLR